MCRVDRSRLSVLLETKFASPLILKQEPQKKARKTSMSTKGPSKSSQEEHRRTSIPNVQSPQADTKKVSMEPPTPDDPDGLPRQDLRKKSAELLINLFSNRIAQRPSSSTSPPSEETPDQIAKPLGIDLERAIHKHYTGAANIAPTTGYRNRLRSLLFNLKKNTDLCDRVLDKNLSLDELAVMPTDKMASEEKQREDAEYKKKMENRHIVVAEEGPRIRRTHKGEEFVDEDGYYAGTTETAFSGVSARPTDNVAEPRTPKETATPISATSSHNIFQTGLSEGRRDSQRNGPEGPANQQGLTIDTSMTPSVPALERKTSTPAFNIKDVWSSVQTPGPERRGFAQQQTTQPAFENAASPQNGHAGVDLEIDQLLDDESPPYSPTDETSDPSVVWRGTVSMHDMTFSATAKHVAGADISARIPWSQLMPPTIGVKGRVSAPVGDGYLCDLEHSRDMDAVVVSITPVGGIEARVEFDRLWSYFETRQKWGVFRFPEPNVFKGVYLIPVEAGMAKLPDFMDKLEHSMIEAPRAERIMLVAFAVKCASTPPAGLEAAEHAGSPSDRPNFNMGHPGQGVPPVSGPGLAGSPVTPQHTINTGLDGIANTTAFTRYTQMAPPVQQVHVYSPPGGSPQTIVGDSYSPSTMSPAQHILGPLADSLVAKHLLAESPDMGASQIGVVKDILERVPAARDNLDLFSQLLTEKTQAERR